MGDYYISLDYFENKMRGFEIFPQDIIVSCAGTIGETYIIPDKFERGIINQALMKMRISTHIYPAYFLVYFDYVLKKYSIDKSKGSAIKNIPPFEIFKEYFFPIPPINEQREIVEKIEKINPLITNYETSSNELNTLNSSYKVELKKSILQYAIQGKLVPQNSDDESAKVLINKILEEKRKLIKEKQVKKENLSVIYKDDTDNQFYEKFDDGTIINITNEIPFDIPTNWSWTRLYNVLEIARGGSPRPIQAFLTEADDGINWIKIGDTEKGGKYINSTKEKIIPEGMKKSRFVKKGDFILSNSMSFGRPYILNIDGCIHDGWLVFSNVDTCFFKDYLYYLLSSNFVYSQFCSRVSGAVVNNLNSDKVKSTLIPLPPQEEQKRIASSLESLFNILADT